MVLQQRTRMWPFWFLLLLGLLHFCMCSLVKTNHGLRVKRGQSAFLQEGDLQFHIPRERDTCKLEVVLNEPITQRVGTLSPQVLSLFLNSLFISQNILIYAWKVWAEYLVQLIISSGLTEEKLSFSLSFNWLNSSFLLLTSGSARPHRLCTQNGNTLKYGSITYR